MSGVKIIKIKAEDDGARLNRWFMKYYPGLSLGRLNKLLRTKQIKLDGKKAETNTKLVAGQELRLPPLDNEAKDVIETMVTKRDEMYIQDMVIYKDKNIIAINKPSGLAVQGGTDTIRHVDGLLDGLKYEYDERPKLVHRIDKNTSGVLVLARTRKAAEELTKAFKEHTLKKSYLALVRGCLDKKCGEIKAPLEKIEGRVHVSNEGKPAITEYEVIDNVSDKVALVMASPLTGRTHQIRAHLEYMEAPIWGDDKYFGQIREKSSLIANKLHLHAYQIDLSALYGKKAIIKASLPDYYKESLKILGLEFKE